MANVFYLLENNIWNNLPLTLQTHIENSINLVYGSKVKLINDPNNITLNPSYSDGIFIIPMLLSAEVTSTEEIFKIITSQQTIDSFYGILYLLIASTSEQKNYALTSLQWLENLDKFYAQSVPIGFSIIYGAPPSIESFLLAASLSSLQRELDSIKEIKKISTQVNELESKINEIKSTQKGAT